jgi:hypothetical protein
LLALLTSGFAAILCSASKPHVQFWVNRFGVRSEAAFPNGLSPQVRFAGSTSPEAAFPLQAISILPSRRLVDSEDRE